MQAWRPWLQQDVSLLKKVQRRMTRIPELRQQSYEVRLRNLGLTTLETRRRRADLIEVFKMFNSLEDIDPKLFFVSQEGCSTRGHRLKILKQRARLDVRKYCFSHRVVNDWNNLPARAIESNTLNEFKGYVDKYLRKYSEITGASELLALFLVNHPLLSILLKRSIKDQGKMSPKNYDSQYHFYLDYSAGHQYIYTEQKG